MTCLEGSSEAQWMIEGAEVLVWLIDEEVGNRAVVELGTEGGLYYRHVGEARRRFAPWSAIYQIVEAVDA